MAARAASRYAKSLLALAQEQNVLDAVKADFDALLVLLKDSRDLQLLLKSPVIKYDKKLLVIEQVFKGKVNDLTLAFFSLLTKKKRENILEDIALAFIIAYNELKNIDSILLTTAQEISPATVASFKKEIEAVTGRTAEMETVVDESVIGGFVLRVGDKQIDNSIKGSLQKIKNKFQQVS